MSSVQNTNYSIASRLYEYHSRNLKSASPNEVQDQVIIGAAASIDGIPQAEVQRNSRRFSDLIKERFNSIRRSELASGQAINSDANLVELASSLSDAEIALQQVVNIRDKLVAGFKQIMESSF